MNQIFDVLFRRLTRHSRLAAIIALLLVVLVALQVRAPIFSGSMVGDISEDNAQLQIAGQIATARGNKETMIIVVEASNMTIREAFGGIESLRTSLVAAGLTGEIRSLDRLEGQLFLLGLTPDEPLVDLLAELGREETMAALVSNDGLLFGIAVTVDTDDEVRALELVRAHAFGPNASKIGILAAAALEQDVASGLRDDLRLLIPSIVAVMLSLLLFAFGHWRALVLPVFASLASATVVFSLLGFLKISINLVTLLALPIVLIVALANSCHFLAKSSRALSSNIDVDAVVALTLSRVAVPYLTSCMTTAVALASLAFNEIGPIRDLGVLSAAGLLISFVLILLFAPWALRWHLGVRGRTVHLSRAYRRFSLTLWRCRRPVAALLLATALASLLTLPSVQVRSDARLFFPDNAPFTEAFRLFEERFYVFAPLWVLVRKKQANAPSLTALRFAGSVRDSLRDAEGVLAADLAPALQGGGFLVTAFVASDTVTARLVENLDGLRAEHGEVYEITYSSGQLVYEGIDRQALGSLVTSLLVTLVIIFGAIVLLFRSLRALVASVVANAMPLLIVFGVVWLVGDPLNLVTAFVFLVALGVIVDDTIHILHRYQNGEALAGSSIEFSVILSTVMLCAGLLLCQLSAFPTTRQFAMYFALALGAAVASDLTLLPALLARRQQNGAS